MKALAMAAGVTLLLVSGASARTIYDCTLEVRSSNKGWVPPAIGVADDAETGEVLVVDPFIEEVYGGPIAVDPTKNNDNTLVLNWNLTLAGEGGNKLQIRYSLTIDKADHEVKMRATPSGYDNDWTAPGSCDVTTD